MENKDLKPGDIVKIKFRGDIRLAKIISHGARYDFVRVSLLDYRPYDHETSVPIFWIISLANEAEVLLYG